MELNELTIRQLKSKNMFSFKRMFILLATLLIVIALLLGLLSVDERGILFYVAEATVAVTLVGLYYFYQKV